MKRILGVIFCLALGFNSFSQKIFVVRHAEKATAEANMSSDVSLSEKGKQRAEALREVLENENIEMIYSTNTIRTKSTAQPIADKMGLQIQTYGPRPNADFAASVLASGKNVLIVGHSNTIDDVVNLIVGETKVEGDLDESQYDNLYVITVNDKKPKLEKKKFGVSTTN
jgi:broad specificity phosphatase PhoE